MSDCNFTQCILNIHQSGYSTVLVVTWQVPHKTSKNKEKVTHSIPQNKGESGSISLEGKTLIGMAKCKLTDIFLADV